MPVGPERLGDQEADLPLGLGAILARCGNGLRRRCTDVGNGGQTDAEECRRLNHLSPADRAITHLCVQNLKNLSLVHGLPLAPSSILDHLPGRKPQFHNVKLSFTARITNTVVVAREGVNFGQRPTKGEDQCDLEVVKRIDPVGHYVWILVNHEPIEHFEKLPRPAKITFEATWFSPSYHFLPPAS